MDGQPRYFGPVHPPQYTWRPFMQNESGNINNWSSGQPQPGPFLPSLYGCILRPPGLHSSFTYGPNGNMNIPKVQQTLAHAPREVQQYLDMNTNGSINGNHNRAKQVVSAAAGGGGGAESELWCNACEKSFQNSSGLDAHLKSHTKCLFPNCSFVASRQALKLHEIQCHRDGKMQIVLDTPEQIAKWRQERKRNYPSVSNIARKKEQEKQRTESGQTIRAKEFRYNNRQGWKHQRGKSGDYRRGRGKNNQSYSQSRESRHTELNTACSPQTIKEDENIASPNENTLDVNSNNIEVDEKDTKETGMNSGALGALACVYAASSSDEDDDNNKEQTQNENIEKSNDQSEPDPIQECKKIKLTPDHVHLAGDGKLTRKKELTNRLRRKKTRKEYTVRKRQKPSLLEMLLAPDIRHERNVILQCLRYIVKKDFFGIGCHGNGSVS